MKLGIIEILVAVVVFGALIGTIITSVNSAGLNGSSLVLAGLFPLFIVIGLVVYILKTSGASKA